MARRACPTYIRAMAIRRQTTRRALAQAKPRPPKAVAVVRTHARQLSESHERFELLARATRDAVWDWDLATNALWWNPNFHALFRYPPEATLPTIESWTDFIHPEDSGRVLGEVHAALEGDAESWSGEYRYQRGDGTYADVFDRGCIVRDRAGKALRMIGMMQDISERKAVERALRQSDERFRALVEMSSDWYWEQDAELRFTMISGPHALVASGGRAPESVVGKRRWELPFNVPIHGDWAAHRATLERREPFRDFLIRRPAREGGVRYVSISGEPVFGAGGEFRGYRGTGSDVTDLLAAGDTLRRFRLALDNSGEMIGILDLETMRYVDVNDPLCAALGYTRNELLQMHPDELIPFTREQLRATYTLLTQGGDVPAIRSHYRCKDGSLLPYESRRHAVRSDGRWLIVSIARDIRRDLAAEEELRQREEAFRAVAENAPDGIMRFDADLRCVYANAAIMKTSGRPAEAMLGRTLAEFDLPARIRDSLEGAVRLALQSGETQTVEFLFQGPRGERYYQARLAPEKGPDGRPLSVLGISRDVTDRKRMEREMEQREARLRSIVHASAEPLLLVDADGRVMFSNPAAAVLFGRAEEGMDGELLGLPLSAGRAVELEILLPTGYGRPVEMQCNATQVDGRTVQVVSLHDLSERKQYEVHIHHLANHDGLTGLPNRTLLRDRVEQAIAHARRLQSHVALMFVDLDQFKLVNDSWGHNAGDTLLLEIASRLKTAVRDGDTVARLGGDEFVVLLQDLAQPGDCTLVARKIESALEAPVEVAGRPVRVTASIGIATFPGDGDDLDALLQCADAAMYQAKDAGRNGYQYYSSEMGAAARARVEIEGGLREALERNELLLHFQPQVRLRDGAVQGCEALLRWQRPGRGLVSPADFIPVAEESGLIVPIGDWVLRAACKEAAAWTQSGLGPMKVAVNLSSRQFWRGSVTDAVRAALDESGLPATQLEVEITESVLARDLDQVMRTLEQLRRMGVCVTIDDFGTGYSSLSYLRSLPIQKLKIDKSFVHGIPGDRQATALVGEIIRLAHVLSLEVVAEGVESAAQGRFLRDAGCEAMQGYFFSRPMPAVDCAAMLRAGRKLGLDG
jgi:diguanylate cyclase (GGDEF)-like protein/PAS domain S-box-containing protein